jgi:hypothetical protein
VGLPRSRQVRQWLEALSDEERAAVDEALAYLGQFGRAAALPDVRHRVQTSSHYPDMSEVRVDLDESRIFRLLACFDPDDLPVLLIGGNKAQLLNRWYDQAVPKADELFEEYLTLRAQAKQAEEGK